MLLEYMCMSEIDTPCTFFNLLFTLWRSVIVVCDASMHSTLATALATFSCYDIGTEAVSHTYTLTHTHTHQVTRFVASRGVASRLQPLKVATGIRMHFCAVLCCLCWTLLNEVHAWI